MVACPAQPVEPVACHGLQRPDPARSPAAGFTVGNLRRLLRERGLPWHGKKAELVARLDYALAADGEELPDPAGAQHHNEMIPVEMLRLGQELKGAVTGVFPSGVFVDVGVEVEGFVHISMLSDGVVHDVRECVSLQEEVTGWVCEFKQNGRFSLSMSRNKLRLRTGARQADLSVFGTLQRGEWFTGIVSHITHYGLFVIIEHGAGGSLLEGLVHLSELEAGFSFHPSEVAEVGQQVRVRVLGDDGRKLSLSMRADPNTAAARIKGLAPSEWLEGTVHHTAPFGVFVDVDPPDGGDSIQGLVHLSCMSEGFVEDPAEEVKLGAKVHVRIVDVDVKAGRVRLSMLPPEGDGDSTAASTDGSGPGRACGQQPASEKTPRS